jgi:hypothetical protein
MSEHSRISLTLHEIEHHFLTLAIEEYRLEFGHAPRDADYAKTRAESNKLAAEFWRLAGAK